MSNDPTKRFSNRVSDYVKYRPGYPAEVFKFLRKEFNLSASSAIADIGAGTGIFTKLLLDEGYPVAAVEPNDAMRLAAVDQLSANKNFSAITGTAEDTTLPAKSIDLIVCAQAFHWFNNERTRLEFKRILKNDGHAAMIWNNRVTVGDDFSVAYDNLLKNESVDYNKVNHQNVSDIDFKTFFSNGIYQLNRYPNEQVFNLEGLKGRAYSSSYVPAPDTEAGKQFLPLLTALFEKYNEDGKIRFRYWTEIYWGKV